MPVGTTIDECHVAASSYMKHLSTIIVADNWLWMVLPVALCGVLAYWFGPRLIIVAPMVLLVVLPTLLAMFYFFYGLSPEALWSMKEKTLTLTDGGITIDFTDERMKTHVIPWDNVRYIIKNDDVVILMLKGHRYRCLMLPASVINPHVTQAFRQFVTQAH